MSLSTLGPCGDPAPAVAVADPGRGRSTSTNTKSLARLTKMHDGGGGERLGRLKGGRAYVPAAGAEDIARIADLAGEGHRAGLVAVSRSNPG